MEYVKKEKKKSKNYWRVHNSSLDLTSLLEIIGKTKISFRRKFLNKKKKNTLNHKTELQKWILRMHN